MLTALLTEAIIADHRAKLCHVYGQSVDLVTGPGACYWASVCNETGREIWIAGWLEFGRRFHPGGNFHRA